VTVWLAKAGRVSEWQPGFRGRRTAGQVHKGIMTRELVTLRMNELAAHIGQMTEERLHEKVSVDRKGKRKSTFLRP
jgi:CBS-domain-containing membrane protein